MLRRDVFSCSRLGGGNYRRAPQWRSSSICAECAIGQLSRAHPDQSGVWSISTIERIVASIDTDEARTALASWNDKVEAKRIAAAAHAERTRPYWDRIHERREIIEWVRAQASVDGMDEATCRTVAAGIKNGEAGHENTGTLRDEADGVLRWERTMREQVIDYIVDATPVRYHDRIDPDTRDALIDGIRAGAHRPDPKG